MKIFVFIYYGKKFRCKTKLKYKFFNFFYKKCFQNFLFQIFKLFLLKMANKQSFNCFACLFEFESLVLFIKHLQNSVSEQTHQRAFYKCFFCSFKCYGNENYALHLENLHLIFQNEDILSLDSSNIKVIFKIFLL